MEDFLSISCNRLEKNQDWIARVLGEPTVLNQAKFAQENNCSQAGEQARHDEEGAKTPPS